MALAGRFGAIAAVSPLARTASLLAQGQDPWGKEALMRLFGPAPGL